MVPKWAHYSEYQTEFSLGDARVWTKVLRTEYPWELPRESTMAVSMGQNLVCLMALPLVD